MEYKATLGTSSKIITSIVTILFLGITLYNFYAFSAEAKNYLYYILITSLIIVTYLICYLLRPVNYILGDGKIIITRPLHNRVVNISMISDVLQASKESMKWTVRTFGNGGLFGYTGKFYSSTYGNMTWYVTKRENYVLLKITDGEKIVLSPDDVGMVEEIKSMKEK